MFTKYIKRVNEQETPIVLSITGTSIQQEPVIQRNNVQASASTNGRDIYIRAREIYFRARRQRPVRAASIF